MRKFDWLLIKIAVITAVLCVFAIIIGVRPFTALMISYFAVPLIDHCNKWWRDFCRD